MSLMTGVLAGVALTACTACVSSGPMVARAGGGGGTTPGAGVGVAPVPPARALVDDAAGHRVAVASLTQAGDGTVRVSMHASGLAPGVHGVHIHAVGSCVAPAFTSAGGHFNPESKHHGVANPAGPHAGDLPNMTVDASGNADYEATTRRVTLTAGPNSLFDADASSLVIHAAPDDNMTDPAGNAGARIACGRIER